MTDRVEIRGTPDRKRGTIPDQTKELGRWACLGLRHEVVARLRKYEERGGECNTCEHKIRTGRG